MKNQLNVEELFRESVLENIHFKHKRKLYDRLYDFLEKTGKNPDKNSKNLEEVELYFELVCQEIL